LSIGWWTPLLFMVGSACFALGSIPGFAELVPASVLGTVFFVGSIFFTSAASLQYLVSVRSARLVSPTGRAWPPGRRSADWWGSIVQLVGTVWFNIDTFEAMQTGFDAQQEDLRVWTPDFVGSICFLLASWFAIMAVCRRPWCVERGESPWWIAQINMAGSIFFMASAFAAFVLPATDDLLDASLANSGTFAGALCFFWAARVQITLSG
jgi:hypothetical protein